MNPCIELGKKRNVVIAKLLQEEPQIPHRVAARILFNEYPELFKNMEIARNAVRKRTGNSGVADRRKLQNNHQQHFREPNAGKLLPIPTPFWDTTPYIFNTEKCLIIGDIHIPFQVNEAIEKAVEYAINKGVKDVILNGDILDHYQQSNFCRTPEVATLQQELKDGKKFLQWLRKKFPKGKIIYKEGNHEERFKISVYRALPEIGRLLDKFTYQQLGCEKLGIEIITDRKCIEIGKLTVIHGHELGKFTPNLVNAARTLQLKAKEISLTHHWHQSSHHGVRTIKQKYVSTWSVGCLCILTPHYMPVNDWRHGCAVYEKIDDEGDFIIHNKTIMKGRVL